MSIIGGLDVHRKQITFDYLDTDTGRLERGQIRPADRARLAVWLRKRFADAGEVHFAVEGCTGWRYVVEELEAAGCVAHLADPADTAAARGRKRRAKTDRADAKLERELLVDGRLPECWIPPSHILDYRALLETYHELHEAHTGWVQRIHAVLFHQGAPSLAGSLHTAEGQARLAKITVGQLSPAGQVQIAVAQQMLAVIEVHLNPLRKRIGAAARALPGAKVLHERLYGVGPVTALALTCWLGGAGRFSSARKAVRFVGLDVTVYASAGKRSPGRLSRQGPPVLRWALYEAARPTPAPPRPTTPTTPQSRNASTVNAPPSPRPARSSERRCTSWTSSKSRPWPPPDPDRGCTPVAPRSTDGVHQPRPAPASGLSSPHRPCQAGPTQTASKE